MSISPQELLLRKISADSHHSSEQSQRRKVPKNRFRELLQASPTRENSRGKDFFHMIAEEEDENCGSGSTALLPPVTTSSSADSSIMSSAATSKLAALQGVMEAAFEKMASCMIVMHSSHEVETTLFLDNSHFASSSLFGTQITIREFSTAPKAFNVEITSNPSAVALIDASKNDLLSAFRNGNFNFTVHRFDTHVERLDDRPLFHRKESADQEQREDGGQ